MNQNSALAGKTALVTGGAKRLGRAVVLALVDRGANVVVHYGSSGSAAQELVASLEAKGGRGWTIQAKLDRDEDRDSLIGRTLETAGSLDILVNSASIFPADRLTDFGWERLEQNVRVNAFAPLVLARDFAESCNGGNIINFLDTRMLDYDMEHASYHLSKRMFASLTRMMAAEFAPSFRVNAVAPGLVLPPKGKDESYLAGLAHTNPLNTYGGEEDITRAVLFLLESPFITGQVIYVDGGRHMSGRFYE